MKSVLFVFSKVGVFAKKPGNNRNPVYHFRSSEDTKYYYSDREDPRGKKKFPSTASVTVQNTIHFLAVWLTSTVFLAPVPS